MNDRKCLIVSTDCWYTLYDDTKCKALESYAYLIKEV